MELEFDTEEEKTDIFNVTPYHGKFNISGAKLIAGGMPSRSVILYRLSKLGQGRMPLLGSTQVDEQALKMFRSWIRSRPTAEENADKISDSTETAPVDQLLQATKSENAAERTLAIEKLLSSVNGAMVALIAIDEASLPVTLRTELIAAGTTHGDPLVRDLFERFLPEDQRVKRLGPTIRPEQILALTGDATRGKALFFKANAVQCRNCHIIKGEGRELGPELTHVAKDKDKAKILENILTPSKEIHKDYVNYLAETKRGKVHTGLLVEKTDDEIVLKDNQHQLIRIPHNEIEILEPQDKSLMPDLLLRDMTAEQAADLLQFLSELK